MKNNKRKWIWRIALPLVLLPALLISLGIFLAEEIPEAPLPSLAITLPDGSATTLGEILKEAAQAEAKKEGAPAAPIPPMSAEPGEVPGFTFNLNRSFLESPQDRDPYRLGREFARLGQIDQAIALLRSVPRGHRQYSRARRFLGWDLYTQELDKPRIGLSFVQDSIRASPLEGNVWQDSYRTLTSAILP